MPESADLWRTASFYRPGWDHADVFGILDRLGDQAMRANRLILNS
jgi:hypothetical protein